MGWKEEGGAGGSGAGAGGDISQLKWAWGDFEALSLYENRERAYVARFICSQMLEVPESGWQRACGRVYQTPIPIPPCPCALPPLSGSLPPPTHLPPAPI